MQYSTDLSDSEGDLQPLLQIVRRIEQLPEVEVEQQVALTAQDVAHVVLQTLYNTVLPPLARNQEAGGGVEKRIVELDYHRHSKGEPTLQAELVHLCI